MRVLVATSEIDPRDGGFSFTVPGELLAQSVPCDKLGCGCRWSFSGSSSDLGTTLAVVADRPDLDEETYGGLDGDPWLAEIAANHDVGAVLVGWWPKGADASVVPLAEWIDRYGLNCEPA